MAPRGALQLVTAPATEPVAYADAQSWLRLDQTTDATLVTSLLLAARRRAEDITGRALITQTWDYFLDAFPDADYWSLSRPLGIRPYRSELLVPPSRQALIVPRPPLQAVTFIKYVDVAGVLQTLNPTAYTVDVATEPARIVPVFGTLWPGTQAVPNAVQVRFVAGYGAAAAAVPAEILAAIQLCTAAWYEYREAVTSENLRETPYSADALLMPYRVELV